MLQQRALARRADALNIIEQRGMDGLIAPRAMSRDGEAMRLVAKLLDAIEHGVARFEQQRLTTLQIDPLASGVAVRPLGHSGNLDL